jgi:hypothetical protein
MSPANAALSFANHQNHQRATHQKQSPSATNNNRHTVPAAATSNNLNLNFALLESLTLNAALNASNNSFLSQQAHHHHQHQQATNFYGGQMVQDLLKTGN